MKRGTKENLGCVMFGILFVGAAFALSMFLIWCSQNKENYKNIECTVIEIGTHDTGDWVVSDSWGIKVKMTNGGTAYGHTYDNVVIGQKIYTQSWTEDGHTYFGTTFSTHPDRILFPKEK